MTITTKLAIAASALAVGSAWFSAANATHFDGVYIGLHAGVADAETDFTFDVPAFPPLEPLSFSNVGAVGGAQIGARFDIGSEWILGLEAAYTGGTIDDTLESVTQADRSRTVEVSDQFTAVVQVGHSWGDWLVYAKGGYANAQIDISSNVISTGALASIASDREDGWTVGIGIDRIIDNNVVFGLSYDFSTYSPDDRLNVNLPPFSTGHYRDIDTDIHVVTARLSWTF